MRRFNIILTGVENQVFVLEVAWLAGTPSWHGSTAHLDVWFSFYSSNVGLGRYCTLMWVFRETEFVVEISSSWVVVEEGTWNCTDRNTSSCYQCCRLDRELESGRRGGSGVGRSKHDRAPTAAKAISRSAAEGMGEVGSGNSSPQEGNESVAWNLRHP